MQYRMRSDASDTRLAQLAEDINRRIQDLGPRTAKAAPAQTLAMVAMKAVDELLTEKRKRERLQTRLKELKSKARSTVQFALDRIDARIASVPQEDELDDITGETLLPESRPVPASEHTSSQQGTADSQMVMQTVSRSTSTHSAS